MTTRSDRLHLLENYLGVLEQGSMSRAADVLGVSAATVSRQIKELEHTVGARLLQRDTHDLAATAAGEHFARDAAALLRSWGTLLDRHAGQQPRNKTLRIVAPIGIGQRILLDLVTDHALSREGLDIHWRLINGPIVFDREGCDLWVCMGPVPDDSLTVVPVGQLETVVVAAPACMPDGAPLTVESLESLGMVALEPHFENEIELRAPGNERVRLHPRTRMMTNNVPSLIRSACRGLGFAVVPRLFAAKELRSGELKVVLPGWQSASLPLNLARAPTTLPRAALDELVSYLRVQIPKLDGVTPR